MAELRVDRRVWGILDQKDKDQVERILRKTHLLKEEDVLNPSLQLSDNEVVFADGSISPNPEHIATWVARVHVRVEDYTKEDCLRDCAVKEAEALKECAARAGEAYPILEGIVIQAAAGCRKSCENDY